MAGGEFANTAAGLVALAEGRSADTEPLFMAAIETLAAIPIVANVADAVEGLAAGVTARGDQARATRLTQLAAGLLDGSRAVESVADAVA